MIARLQIRPCPAQSATAVPILRNSARSGWSGPLTHPAPPRAMRTLEIVSSLASTRIARTHRGIAATGVVALASALAACTGADRVLGPKHAGGTSAQTSGNLAPQLQNAPRRSLTLFGCGSAGYPTPCMDVYLRSTSIAVGGQTTAFGYFCYNATFCAYVTPLTSNGSTEKSAVATVGSNGVITGRGPGQTAVYFVYNGVFGSTVIPLTVTGSAPSPWPPPPNPCPAPNSQVGLAPS